MDKAEALYREIIEGYEERKYMAKKDSIKKIAEYATEVNREGNKKTAIDFMMQFRGYGNSEFFWKLVDKEYDEWVEQQNKLFESNQEDK